MIDPSGITKYLERLTRIYFALIALPLLLFPVIYLPIKDSPMQSFSSVPKLEGVLYYIAALFLFLVVFSARRLYKRSLAVITGAWPFEQKLKGYKRTSITFYIFCLVSGLISVILLFVTEQQLFVVTYPVLLLLISLYRPTIQRLKRELPLNEKELEMIKNLYKQAKNVG